METEEYAIEFTYQVQSTDAQVTFLKDAGGSQEPSSLPTQGAAIAPSLSVVGDDEDQDDENEDDMMTIQEIETQYNFTRPDFKMLQGKEKKAHHSRRKFFCRKDVHEAALKKYGEKELAAIHERIEQDRKRAKFEHDIDEIAHKEDIGGGTVEGEGEKEEAWEGEGKEEQIIQNAAVSQEDN